MPRSTLDHRTLDLLDQAIEVEARTPRQDGSISSRPIWVVVVDGEPYVRSYRAERGAWYRWARSEGRLGLAVEDAELDLAAEPIDDEEVNRRVSQAYRAKYGARSPGPTETMVGPEVTVTTLRLSDA